MSRYAEEIAKAFFSTTFEAGLFLKGREIKPKGYGRSPVSFEIEGSNGRAEAVFKFDGYARFDEVRVFHDGREIDRIAYGGEQTLTPRVELTQPLELTIKVDE